MLYINKLFKLIIWLLIEKSKCAKSLSKNIENINEKRIEYRALNNIAMNIQDISLQSHPN